MEEDEGFEAVASERTPSSSRSGSNAASDASVRSRNRDHNSNNCNDKDDSSLPFAAEVSKDMEDVIAERDALRMQLEYSNRRLKEEQRKLRENGGSSQNSVLPILVESVQILPHPDYDEQDDASHQRPPRNARCFKCLKKAFLL